MMRKLIITLLMTSLAISAWAGMKITDYPADTSPTTDDLTITVDSPSSNAANKKVTLGDLVKLSGWTKSGSIVSLNTSTDSVGVGDSSGIYKFAVSGAVDGSSVESLSYFYNTAAIANGYVSASVIGDNTNSGSNAAGVGHYIGVLGRTHETTGGNHFSIGVEGKTMGTSNNAHDYYGLAAYQLWQGTGTLQDTSNFIGLRVQTELTTDGNTANPKSNATVYGIDIKNTVGSKNNYGLLIEPQSGGSALNVAMAVGGATGAGSNVAFWLNYGANSTTAAGGIYFGASLDTDLYRSASATLTTDGSLIAGASIKSTATTNIGWSVVTGADTACNTTCTNACVFGQDTGAATKPIVDCADATADRCVCAGAN